MGLPQLNPGLVSFQSTHLKIARFDGDAPSPGTPPPLSCMSTLGDLWSEFYLPEVALREKQNDEKTIERYEDTVKLWKQHTGDPPLLLIDKEVFYDRFCAKLDETLAPDTAYLHKRNARTILFRAGPRNADPKRPSAGLLTADQVQHFSLAAPAKWKKRPRHTVPQAQLVFQSCSVMAFYGCIPLKDRVLGGRPRASQPLIDDHHTRGAGSRQNHRRGDGGAGAPDRWRAAIATFYYTGLRLEALQTARLTMLVEDEDGRTYLELPPDSIKGGKKGVRKYVHPHALWLIRRLPYESPDAFIFDFLRTPPKGRRGEPTPPNDEGLFAHTHLLERHEFLQREAGTRKICDFHGWRCLHDDVMFKLGVSPALLRASESSGHEDVKTTANHYVDIDAAIDAFPLLDPNWVPPRPKPAASSQLGLFS